MGALRHGLCALAALWLAGCLDLDALRARASDGNQDCDASTEGCRCVGDVRDLRLWTLYLGKNDYVTIRNQSECTVELGGVQLFFDDHSELYPDEELDCLVQLPPLPLLPQAEVRVHENGLKGDIAALDYRVRGCDHDLPFNANRGGVAYLCDGACDEAHVIDMVAFQGMDTDPGASTADDQPPPPLYNQQIEEEEPLYGVTSTTQESARFRRWRLEGTPPVFRASDWILETRIVYADFESAVEVEIAGAPTGFVPESGQTATLSTSENAAVGNVSLKLEQRGSSGRSEGLAIVLPLEAQQPTHIGYFTRTDSLRASAGYFDLQFGDRSVVRAGFDGSSVGTKDSERAYGVLASQGAFHQVELRNIDWNAREYDLYVDRRLIAPRVQFEGNVSRADRVSLYSVTSGSTAYWDAIELWQ